ncbi:uncharacterized protein EV420DRAFT_1483374 [Desarmillaria tabescens]|uniref:Uncharacterized protein n=1 Tax=Armillaria tabescens TaxID=1929756 RepID=A0AA39MVW1_ARMTA|nr:uncharacterized protein EV420DRAFT_1483374 [Desarmillaria tabescens]KAK0448966.1 hypothetical protein EV420DRAFT_1483374 [Desarmillaria tabescens]
MTAPKLAVGYSELFAVSFVFNLTRDWFKVLSCTPASSNELDIQMARFTKDDSCKVMVGSSDTGFGSLRVNEADGWDGQDLAGISRIFEDSGNTVIVRLQVPALFRARVCSSTVTRMCIMKSDGMLMDGVHIHVSILRLDPFSVPNSPSSRSNEPELQVNETGTGLYVG